MKRYVIIFTCLPSYAVHVEAMWTIETNFSIEYLWRWRFDARCGNICLIRCGNGTNFIGAQHVLQKTSSEIDEEQIMYFFQRLVTDLITCRKNPLSKSYMGKVCKRHTRSAQGILLALMKKRCISLNYETLVTFLVKVECINNCRPMIAKTISDIGSEAPSNLSKQLTNHEI